MKTNRISLCLACCLLLPTIALTFTGCASGRYERTTGEYIDDNIITTRVAAALSTNPEYKFNDVIVASHQSNVQLSGFVASGDQKGRAEDIAKKVQGVKGVENNITVRP